MTATGKVHFEWTDGEPRCGTDHRRCCWSPPIETTPDPKRVTCGRCLRLMKKFGGKMKTTAAAMGILLSGCASYSGTINPDGAVRFDVLTTREVSAFYAEQTETGFSVSIGNASGVEGMADAIAERVLDKIPTEIPPEIPGVLR